MLELARKEASKLVEEVIATEKEAEENVNSLASLMGDSVKSIKTSDTEE